MPYQIDDIRSDPGHAMTRADRPRAPGARIPIAACIAIAACLGLHPSAMAATGVTDWLNVHDFGVPPNYDIQAAIDATDNEHKVVYIPGGSYYLGAGLIFPTDREVRLVGDGPGRTFLRAQYQVYFDFITVRGGRQQIEDLSIYGQLGQPGATGNGIVLDPASTPGDKLQLAAIRRCQFYGIPDWGIRIVGDVNGVHQVNDAVIEDCDMQNIRYGVYTSGVATAIAMRNMNVTASDTCFRFVNSHDVSLDNCLAGSDEAVMVKATDCTGITLNQCDIEESSDQNPFLTITGTNNAQYMVANCVFRRSARNIRLAACDFPSVVRNLTVLNPEIYIDHNPGSDPTRTDDIVLGSGSSAVLIGGYIAGEVESGTPFRISGNATEVFTANFNQRVRIPSLTAAQRDSLKDMAAGDVISNDNRLKHWDGARWREVVGFFPLTAASNAPPAGVAMPMVDSTSRDAIPAAVRPEGSLFYNSTTHRLQHYDGSQFLEEVATVSGTERNYAQRTSGISLSTLISSAPAGQYRISLTALSHTLMNGNLTIKLHWTDERSATQDVMLTLNKTPGPALFDLRTVYIPSGGSLTFETTSITSGSFDLHIRVEALH